MMMKNPVHPGKLVEVNLKELGLKVAEAAKSNEGDAAIVVQRYPGEECRLTRHGLAV